MEGIPPPSFQEILQREYFAISPVLETVTISPPFLPFLPAKSDNSNFLGSRLIFVGSRGGRENSRETQEKGRRGGCGEITLQKIFRASVYEVQRSESAREIKNAALLFSHPAVFSLLFLNSLPSSSSFPSQQVT